MISKIGKKNWKGVKDYLYENPDKRLPQFDELPDDVQAWVDDFEDSVIKDNGKFHDVHPLFEYDLYVKDTK